jgi:hypothetical protein
LNLIFLVDVTADWPSIRQTNQSFSQGVYQSMTRHHPFSATAEMDDSKRMSPLLQGNVEIKARGAVSFLRRTGQQPFIQSYWNGLRAEKEGGEPMFLISCTRLD